VHLAALPPLRGSAASLERQNQFLNDEGLERIEDEPDLADRIAHKFLVPVPTSALLTINEKLAPSHRYCRPWTARFLSDLARAHAAHFSRALEVTSAVRTVEYQKKLMETNGNAAPAEGEVASPHLTGATIDIAKPGMTTEEVRWMRNYLAPLEKAGKLDVEEEFRQACFHITVYKSYMPPAPPPAAPVVRAKAEPKSAVPAPPAKAETKAAVPEKSASASASSVKPAPALSKTEKAKPSAVAASAPREHQAKPAQPKPNAVIAAHQTPAKPLQPKPTPQKPAAAATPPAKAVVKRVVVDG
jgi:hypothetical protein